VEESVLAEVKNNWKSPYELTNLIIFPIKSKSENSTEHGLTIYKRGSRLSNIPRQMPKITNIDSRVILIHRHENTQQPENTNIHIRHT